MTGFVMVGDAGVVCEGDACVLPTARSADQQTIAARSEALQAPTASQPAEARP